MPFKTGLRSILVKKTQWDQQLSEIDGTAKPSGLSGFFTRSSNLVYKPIMIDNSQHLDSAFESGVAVLNIIEPFIIEEAAVDSSARDPPPRCHPGTRAQLHKRLDSWLVDKHRLWNMIWLRGPAGTGKSAVAQTFAEHAGEQGRLGAAFFFSKPNKRNKPLHVIPTLAYQLASQHSDYRALLTPQLVNNRLILKATLRVQFKKLIFEPFSILARRSPIAREPLLIVLDGLDECEGEDAQCEIIEIISEAAQSKHKLPFLWLVCSRPEPHITNTFSGVDFSIECGREQLVLDLETRNDVDQYLRDGFRKIYTKYADVMSVSAKVSWPSDADFGRVSDAASGLFIFAVTALKYIGDAEYANPRKQLRHFLEFLDNSQVAGIRSPWDTLDLLYTRILSEIPDHTLSTTLRILAIGLRYSRSEAQVFCNFLRLEQDDFYTALRRLHAVIEIPPPEKAMQESLRLYHRSFQDYLLSPTRSLKYFVDVQFRDVEITKCALYWCELPDIRDSNTDQISVRGDVLPSSWPPPDGMMRKLCSGIANITTSVLKFACEEALDGRYPCFIPLVSRCKFGNLVTRFPWLFMDVIRLLYELDQKEGLGGTIIRTDINGSVDARHLEHLSLLVGTASPLKPIVFPITVSLESREGKAVMNIQQSTTAPAEGIYYFFLGSGPGGCIVCYTCRHDKVRCDLWRADRQPSKDDILDFRRHMLL